MDERQKSPLVALALTALVISSCGIITGPGSQGDTVFSIGDEFTLSLGQRALTRDSSVIVTFSEVPEESRCPTDLVCVWEGFARIALDLDVLTDESEISLTTNATVCCVADSASGYVISLVQLDPVPRSDQTDPEYRARLIVDRLEP